MKPIVFWPAVSVAFVLGLGLVALGLVAAADPEGRGGAIFFAAGSGGLLLVIVSLVAILVRVTVALARRRT
jgi:hypothetical protein